MCVNSFSIFFLNDESPAKFNLFNHHWKANRKKNFPLNIFDFKLEISFNINNFFQKFIQIDNNETRKVQVSKYAFFFAIAYMQHA